MKCIECESVEECGTVKRWTYDFCKNELIKKLTEKNVDCLNFSFRPLEGELLRQKIFQLTELSKNRRMAQKELKKRSV
jgi:hypothetical protein